MTIAAISGHTQAGHDDWIGQLDRQCELYGQLKALSDRQSQLVRQGQAEQLLGVLSARQKVIDELAAVHAAMAPLRTRWTDIYAGLSMDKKSHVSRQLKQVEQLLASIIEQDERDRRELDAVRQEVGGALQRTVRSGAAVSAYRTAGSAAPAARSWQQG